MDKEFIHCVLVVDTKPKITIVFADDCHWRTVRAGLTFNDAIGLKIFHTFVDNFLRVRVNLIRRSVYRYRIWLKWKHNLHGFASTQFLTI